MSSVLYPVPARSATDTGTPQSYLVKWTTNPAQGPLYRTCMTQLVEWTPTQLDMFLVGMRSQPGSYEWAAYGVEVMEYVDALSGSHVEVKIVTPAPVLLVHQHRFEVDDDNSPDDPFNWLMRAYTEPGSATPILPVFPGIREAVDEVVRRQLQETPSIGHNNLNLHYRVTPGGNVRVDVRDFRSGRPLSMYWLNRQVGEDGELV